MHLSFTLLYDYQYWFNAYNLIILRKRILNYFYAKNIDNLEKSQFFFFYVKYDSFNVILLYYYPYKFLPINKIEYLIKCIVAFLNINVGYIDMNFRYHLLHWYWWMIVSLILQVSSKKKIYVRYMLYKNCITILSWSWKLGYF